MTILIVLLVLDFVVYYWAWFYGWGRLGRTAPEQREALEVPSPWKDFSYELFAFTASGGFLRITDTAARRAFGLTLVLSLVPALLLLAFWLTLPV